MWRALVKCGARGLGGSNLSAEQDCHRPDLKQLVLGMSVTADGAVPVTHKIYDGNQSDDRLHAENHQRLRKLLQRSDFIYVADCKLASKDNLHRIAACGGLFVTVMPRTWKEDKSFRVKLRKGKVEWRHLLSRKNNRNPNSKMDRYYLAQGTHKAKGYRLLWIRSTQKAEQDQETRTRHIESAMEDLRAIQVGLNKYNLKTRREIRHSINKVLKQHQCSKWVVCQIHSYRQYKRRYTNPGRPKAGEKGRLTWSQYYSISFEINGQALQEESIIDGVFPIITNLPEKQYKPKKALEIYKFQPFLEKRHSQLRL